MHTGSLFPSDSEEDEELAEGGSMSARFGSTWWWSGSSSKMESIWKALKAFLTGVRVRWITVCGGVAAGLAFGFGATGGVVRGGGKGERAGLRIKVSIPRCIRSRGTLLQACRTHAMRWSLEGLAALFPD